MAIEKTNNAIFITGISASGKTTLAEKLIKDLRSNLYNVILLDGTEMYEQSILFPFDGHTLSDREQRAKHHIRLVKWISMQGILPIIAFIGQPLEIRELWSLELDDWKEIYLKCDINVCIKRDNKNLYNISKNKVKQSIIGLDDRFDEPSNPWFTIDSNYSDANKVKDIAWEKIQEIEWLNNYQVKNISNKYI